MEPQIHLTTKQIIVGIGVILFVVFIFQPFLFVFALVIGIYVFTAYKKGKISIDFSKFMNEEVNKKTMAKTFDADGNEIPKKKSGHKVLSIFLLTPILVWVIYQCIIVVGAGQTGVVSLFGKVREEELHSGIHVVNPLLHVQKMSIRTEQYTMSIAHNEGQVQGDDSIKSLTKEGLDVNIDFTALYRLDEDKASDIYRDVGLNYVDKLVRPSIRGVIRDVVSQYEAKELYSEKRLEASMRMATMLREQLEPRGLVIEEAVIRNVELPPSLAEAIQAKLAAEQEAQRYDFVLEKEKKEAERKIIEAQGQRDSQTIINESLSPEYLNYLYIKELKDRQGTIYVPIDSNSGIPIFKGI